MRSITRARRGTAAARRGLTLVEMLVAMAILILMMTVLTQIFQVATGTMNAAQAYQELDNKLRHLDGTIRGDLAGVTCTMTPPLDPKDNKGYFEYGENEFADYQGEDTDDYIRFTAKAPQGRLFTGRMFVNPLNLTPPIPFPGMVDPQFFNLLRTQPVTITSQYAEIIYFVRNGNLYRRVLLILPSDSQGLIFNMNRSNQTLAPLDLNAARGNLNNFPSLLNAAALGGNPASWQGLNDISARPNPTGVGLMTGQGQGGSILLNTLGDLTNRENRAFMPRFGNDFAGPAGLVPDGTPDDLNGDSVPDFHPTLYPSVFDASNTFHVPLIYEQSAPLRIGIDAQTNPGNPTLFDCMAFPYIFPGAYTKPQPLSGGNWQLGWVHSPNPDDDGGRNLFFDQNPLGYLQQLNHSPLDLGDNLPQPFQNAHQTWWGFPTWRETLSPNWNDPAVQVNLSQAQPRGLHPQAANNFDGNGRIPDRVDNLPAMTVDYRLSPQSNTDGFGGASVFGQVGAGGGGIVGNPQWPISWEDDLIMTGVRSFDVKAYDNSLANFADLGWGDDVRSSGFGSALFLAGNADQSGYGVYPPLAMVNKVWIDLINTTMMHEGRIPPLVADHRLDAQHPDSTMNYAQFLYNSGSYTPPYPAFPAYTSNVGDNNPAIPRLRRVWDTWSTDYTRAPATGIDPVSSLPVGPPFSPPVYPSYPPPYPAPLRSIQIQIRVVDPSNSRVKTLTIRQDFTDKLK